MFDINRRKLLLGSLITGVALSTPVLAFAEDRYQVLMRLQQDVLDTLKGCRAVGHAHYEKIGYEAKNAAYVEFQRNRGGTLTHEELRTLSDEVLGAQKYMSVTTRAAWRLTDGNAKAETMMRYLLTDFNRSDLTDPIVRERVRDLLTGKMLINTLDANQLRQVEDAVVCVAIVKSMFAVYCVPMDVAMIPSFEDFAMRYRDLIVR